MTLAPYNTVPKEDYLSLYRDSQKVNYDRVKQLLSMNSRDLAEATGRPVKLNARIPIEIQERFTEWANLLNLVAGFFHGDPEKTALWFKVPNPLLGNVSPRDMIRVGRFETLWSFVTATLNENQPPQS